MKDAVIYEEAKRLYVYEGFSLDAIVKMIPNVSRKTLYNWKVKNNWDDQRKKHAEVNEDLAREILDIARKTIQEAKANPTPHNIYAVVKAISALKLLQGVNIDVNSKEHKKTIKKETLEFIQKELLGL
jgi:hypothetical protein